MQQIVSQLIFNGQEGINLSEVSPWLDMRSMSIEEIIKTFEEQEHRRIIKTHSPADAIPIVKEGKYLLVARDGRDIVMSLHNHYLKATDETFQLINKDIPKDWRPLGRPKGDERQYFAEWLESDGSPVGSFWDYMKSWQDIRHLPNVLFVHYNNLKRDLYGEIKRISDFLSLDITGLNMEKILYHCSFDYMKARPKLMAPYEESLWEPGTFFYKGTNRRWEGVIDEADSEKYERILEERLGPQFAYWIKTGEDE
jgi:aryl sulfotransferase